MKILYALPLVFAAPLVAAVPSPQRPLTDPRSLVSASDPQAAPIPIDDLVFTRGSLGQSWSADGKSLFLSTNLTGRYNLWRTAADGSWPIQLTQSDEAQRSPITSPDGRWLYYLQDKGGNERYDVYAVPTTGGAPRNLTKTPDIREDGLIISQDGSRIGMWTKHGQLGTINAAVMDSATGQVRELTHETDTAWEWEPVAWTDDGRTLIANRSQAGSTAAEVWSIDVATGAAKRILGKPGVIYLASGATRDGSTIAIATNEGTKQLHAALYRASGRSIEPLRQTPWEQLSGAISPDGRSLVVVTNEDGRQVVEIVDVATRAERPLALPPGVNSAPGPQPFSPDSRRLLISHAGADSPAELVTVDLATSAITPVTHFAMASLSPEHLPKSRVVTYVSFDGTPVSAIVTLPFNARRDASNPAVVLPHGGPTGQALDSFSRTATALASRGYFVIQPNPRGSTGYGLAFQKANYQDLGGGDLKDELAAKDFLVATGYVDPKRVGITGGSYGGFMTLMAIGRAPDAFAAAVEMFGIIDWRTMWQNGDLRAYQRSLLGAPEQFPKIYDATSPLTYISAVKAPLLVEQGENDVRVPAGQARQVVDQLRKKGNVVDAVFYPGEGHGFLKREHQQDSLQRLVDWFDRYLKKSS